MKVACIQMASGPDVQSNLLEAQRWAAKAVSDGAELLVLPENFAQMGMQETDKLDIKEVFGKGVIQDFLADVASQWNVWVVGGAIPIQATYDNKVRSSTLLYNNNGECVQRYDKVHLFDVSLPEVGENYCESDTIEAGDKAVVVDTPFGKLGLAICYDLRFPELFRLQLSQGMEILAIPSAFTEFTGKAHWQSLLTARAIENQCYVLAANQGGYHLNGRATYGHSMIIDPWGNIVDCLPSGAGYALAEIDLAKVTATRKNFPATQHRCL